MWHQFLKTMDFEHVSVLLSETIESLNIGPEGTYETAHLGEQGIRLRYAGI